MQWSKKDASGVKRFFLVFMFLLISNKSSELFIFKIWMLKTTSF